MVSQILKRRTVILATALVATVSFLGTAAAQKASAPKAQDRLALGEEHVKQLVLLMESDKTGMVSKQSYMKYMEAEFDRLDTSKQGQLNARQLAQSNVTASRYVGK